MLIDISPLRRHRDFRLLFIGQLISFLGSMASYMAVPYQVYQLTKSNAVVGAQRQPARIRPPLPMVMSDRPCRGAHAL
jgi:hypothetical protein